MTFKENWLKEDIKCEKCGQVTERVKGLTKQSMKKLLSFDYKNLNEWLITILLIGICVLSLSYKDCVEEYNKLALEKSNYLPYVNSEYNDPSEQGNETNGYGMDGLDINIKENIPWITQ